MPKIMKNGVEYGGNSDKVTNAYLSGRTHSDRLGNDIEETYVKISEKDTYVKTSTFTGAGNAGCHNSIYRGEDITTRFESGDMYEKIADGSFEDLWIGDHFDATINGTKVVCRIAGFNIYWGNNGSFEKNHIVVVPDTALTTAKMNSSNTTAGGYTGSAMRTSTIPSVNTWLKATFGDHLLTIKEYLTNAMDSSAVPAGYRGWSGAASGVELVDSTAELMSEVEVYGTRIWSSSRYDNMTGRSQLPLFALAPEYINPSRFNWWLRCITSSTYFAIVASNGGANYNYASSSNGVRPRFLLG